MWLRGPQLLVSVHLGPGKALNHGIRFRLGAHQLLSDRLTLQLTRHCNLNCYYCYCHPLHGGQPSGLEFHALARFLDAASPYTQSGVVLTGGEPLVYPEIDRLPEHLSANKQFIALETNGALLTAQHLRLLSAAGAHIAVTLESTNPAIHDNIRGQTGSWELGCRALASARELPQITTQITFNLTPFSKNEVVEACNLGLKLGVSRIKLNPIYKIGPRGRTISRNKYLSVDDLIQISAVWTESVRGRYDFIVDLALPPAVVPEPGRYDARQCHGCDISHIIGVIYDGKIRPCHNFIFDDEKSILGSIYEDYSIPEMLQSLKKLPGAEIHQLSGICSRCSLVFRCKGFCRAEANVDFGNTAAPNKLCQELYDSGRFPNHLLLPDIFERSYPHKEHHE
jgi:radical SAM protein with 4Fe4S-binding SPASM domain